MRIAWKCARSTFLQRLSRTVQISPSPFTYLANKCYQKVPLICSKRQIQLLPWTLLKGKPCQSSGKLKRRLKVDSHWRVITCVKKFWDNVWTTCVNVYASRSYTLSLNFFTHVKITRQWKSTLRQGVSTCILPEGYSRRNGKILLRSCLLVLGRLTWNHALPPYYYCGGRRVLFSLSRLCKGKNAWSQVMGRFAHVPALIFVRFLSAHCSNFTRGQTSQS